LDFEFEEGEHFFEQLFIRVAARYLQVNAPEGVEVLSVGLLPTLYPVTERSHTLSGLDARIYETSVRTLRLCMNLHYEDCPWREQALYVLDSRNQMLCGYRAFKETEFQRANLVFMAKGTRADGLLELTYPAVNTLAIPFFSLMYPVAVYEYIEHTGDRTILPEVMPTMRRFMEEFRSRIGKNGLIAELSAPYWNFYEWTNGSADKIPTQIGYEYKDCFHLILNCAFVYSAKMFCEMCDMAGVEWTCDFDAVKQAINDEFFDHSDGNFVLRTDNRSFKSQLGNSFALLIGLGDERTVKAIKEDKN
jgi:hypothetical protein